MISQDSQQLRQGKGDDETRTLCATVEGTGYEEGGRPVAPQSQTPEILGNFKGCVTWLQSTVITSQTSRDPRLLKRCLIWAYVNHLTMLNRQLKANNWYQQILNFIH
jgi:hypothetical protein